MRNPFSMERLTGKGYASHHGGTSRRGLRRGIVGERYDRQAEEVLDVLDGLYLARLWPPLSDRSTTRCFREHVARRRTPWRRMSYFLKGRALMHSPDWNKKLEARSNSSRPSTLMTSFRKHWAQLAHTFLYEFFLDNLGQGLERAQELATRAMQINEEEPWCHLVLELSYLYRRQFELALKHCQRSVQLNPSDPALSAKLGLVMIDMGNGLEAIPIIRKAMQLNPLNADAYSDYLALALMVTRRFKEALEVLESNPQDAYYYHAWLAICHAQLNDQERARWHGAKTMEMEPAFTLRRVAEREPFRNPSDLELWVTSLRMAGVRDF